MGKFIKQTLSIAIAIAIAIFVLNAFGVHLSGISLPGISSLGAPGAGWGVHVCIQADFDHHDVICKQDDHSIEANQFINAWINATGQGGSHFTATSLTVILSKQTGDGSWTEEGRTTLDTGLSDNTGAWSLGGVFVRTSTMPENGDTYQFEVDEGGTNLGTVSFTFHGTLSSG